MGGRGWKGGIGAAALLALTVPASPASPAPQVPFEQSLTDLTSADAGTRLRAVRMLKDAAYLESAVPLAKLVTDPRDEIQLEAIAAELNIFLAEKVITRKRVGYVVEMRKTVSAEPVFSMGLFAIGARPVPSEVLTALLAGVRDDNPRVAIEALYAFGSLAAEPSGAARRELLAAAGPQLSAQLGASDPAMRYGAARVIGRVFAKRTQDEAVDESVGDAVIVAVNDKDRTVKATAMQALGALRYDRAVQGLIDLFNFHGKGVEAEAALDAVARIASPGSEPVLTAQLTSKIAALRGIAIEGLARLGDASKLEAIDGAVRAERNDGVLLAAAFAKTMLANASIDAIGEALVKPRLHDQAKQYLVELAPGRAALFTRHVQDPDPLVRADVADALGASSDAAALPLVEPLVRDADPAVARAAERAVTRLRAATGTPPA